MIGLVELIKAVFHEQHSIAVWTIVLLIGILLLMIKSYWGEQRQKFLEFKAQIIKQSEKHDKEVEAIQRDIKEVRKEHNEEYKTLYNLLNDFINDIGEKYHTHEDKIYELKTDVGAIKGRVEVIENELKNKN